jgi:CxxC motif-containing protein (DUF1111 family)
MGTSTRRSRIKCVGHRSFVGLSSASGGVLAVCLVVSLGAPRLTAAGGDGKNVSRQAVAQGRALFEREWQTGDSRTHGGDGLGPVYNDSSCIACHNMGGTGGAGSAGKNVDIITAAPNGQDQGLPPVVIPQQRGFLNKAIRSLLGLEQPAKPDADGKTAATAATASKPARRKIDTTELVKAHPGFRTSRSVVLHRFGTDESYERWRQTVLGFPGGAALHGGNEMMQVQLAVNFEGNVMQNQLGQFFVTRSQRNPTALFGAGLIDSIADSDIEAAAKVKYPDFPQIAGRVSRLKDKRIGRFGWKSQTASLSDFVLTACAVELGLEVPAHHQGGSPQQPDAVAKGLDLDAQECASLVAYVTDLPRPAERKPESEREANEIEAGRGLFAKVGCATCHSPKLGNVENIYSDLLLHDLGPALGDVGQYGVFDPSSSEDEIVDDPGSVAATTEAPHRPMMGSASIVQFGGPGQQIKRPTSGPASRFEWRTPALWGLRDSAPYLHDGRAKTLDQAIAFHGGEAGGIAGRFFKLTAKERLQFEAFLKSLTAPAAADLVASAR